MREYVVKIRSKDAMNQSEVISMIDALIKDEDEAIAAYKSALQKMPQFKEQLTHILYEEIEHKRELEELKQ